MRAAALLPLLLLAGIQPPQEPSAEQPMKPYRYKTVEVEGWTVMVQRELDREDELRDQVLRLLEVKLWEITTRLSPEVVERLREVPLRMHLDRAGCPGGVYHPSAGWLRNHGYPTDWAEGVEFGNARNFLSWSRQQPWMVLHELAHAWHHQVLGYDHAGIRKAYAAARDGGTLEEVLYIDGGRQRHYALNNEQEFFAEMTEAWFGTNDFYPFVRGEVADAFPQLGPLLDAAWAKP
jgi:hypothetical protein